MLIPMAAQEEELEKKIGNKIEAVRVVMLDRFSVVDQKLTSIEELLKKIIETQNPIGKPLETGNPDYGNSIEKDMGGVQSSKIQQKGRKVAIGGGDGAPPQAEKPWWAKIPCADDDWETDDHLWGPRVGLHLGDQGRRWVGLYSNHYGKDNPPGFDLGMERDICAPVWVGQQESDFRRRNGLPIGFREGTSKGQCANGSIEGCPRTRRGRDPEGFGKKVVKADETGWDGKKSINDDEKGWGKKVVETGQDEIVEDSLKSNQLGTKKSWAGSSDSQGKKAVGVGQDENFKDSNSVGRGTKESWTGSSGSWGKTASETDASGEKIEQTSSWASLGKTKNDKTDVSLQDSSNSDQWAKRDYGSWGKAVENETTGKWAYVESDKGSDWSKIVEQKSVTKHVSGAPWGMGSDNKPQVHVATEGSNEKGHEESQKQGSLRLKDEGWGPKRKHPDSPAGGSNDGPISSGPFTATRQRLDMFTSDELDILNEIEPIMQSIKRIMNHNGYNDGDPLSADDQTFVLENVFDHHPDKAQKMGAGVDYIMVSKYMKFRGSRCFYVVSIDGSKEAFSYHKCLKNFVSKKYPERVDEFMPKYFKTTRSRPPGSRGYGCGPDKASTPRSRSGWNRGTRVAAHGGRTTSPARHKRRRGSSVQLE